MWEQWTQRLRGKTIIYACFFIVICSMRLYFTSYVICCTPATATSLRQDYVCRQPCDRNSQLRRCVAACWVEAFLWLGPTCNYPVDLSAAYGTIARPEWADPVCEGHTTVHIILISAFSEYRPPLHIYILTLKQIQFTNMEPIPLDDPIKYLGIVR